MHPYVILGLTLEEEIEQIRALFDWDREQKLRVDEDEEVGDTMRFYKRRDFKPLDPYIVSYRDQEAADAGGVSRQFFTNLFGKFKVGTKYFEGPGKH